MLTVSIYSWDGKRDAKVGQVMWDGEKITSSGGRSASTVAREPVMLCGGKLVGPEDGERFIRALPLQYKSAYLRAAEPVES